MMTALLSVGAWAVDDISLSVVKAGMSPNWAASVSDENVVTLKCGGAVEWALFPAISSANYTGVEVVFAAAPTIAEGQSVSLSVYYEGESDAESTTYASGTTLSATFAADKKVSMVALTTGWSEQDALHATFTLSSATIKRASGTATAPSANLSLPFGKITAPGGWGLTKSEGTQNLTISQYSSAGWTFTTAVKTTEYTGINLTLTKAPAEGGSITIKYDGWSSAEGADNSAFEQKISVNASTTSVVADFDKTGTVTGIYFNGDGWHDPNNAEDQPLGDLTYGIGNCYLVVASAETPAEPTDPDATTYGVIMEQNIENGTIVADNLSAAEGTTVTLTITSDAGYQLSKLIIEKTAEPESANARRRVPAVGSFITATKQNDGTWTFVMPACHVIISATFAQKTLEPTLAYDKATRTVTITNTEYADGNNVTATLYYTLNDGTEQTTTDASVSEVITENTAVKAWIVSTETGSSDNVEETFSVAAKPTVAYTDGENKVSLALTAATATNTADSKLYYTTDGSEPTTGSTLLTADGDIDITEDMTTVKVLALDADGNYSEIVEQSVAYAYYLTAAQQWTTCYSPKTFAVPAGLKAYTVKSVTAPADGESGTIEVTEQTVIAKNTPMLILNESAGTTDQYRVYTTDDQTITGTATEFKGVDVATQLPNDGTLRYVLVNGVFVRSMGDTLLPACRCYLELSATYAAASRFTIVFDGGTTGINEELRVKSEEGSARRPEGESQFATAQWYDLQGHRVMQPQKGINIINGKKIFIR